MNFCFVSKFQNFFLAKFLNEICPSIVYIKGVVMVINQVVSKRGVQRSNASEGTTKVSVIPLGMQNYCSLFSFSYKEDILA